MPNLDTQTSKMLRLLDRIQDEAFWKENDNNFMELNKTIRHLEMETGYVHVPMAV